MQARSSDAQGWSLDAVRERFAAFQQLQQHPSPHSPRTGSAPAQEAAARVPAPSMARASTMPELSTRISSRNNTPSRSEASLRAFQPWHRGRGSWGDLGGSSSDSSEGAGTRLSPSTKSSSKNISPSRSGASAGAWHLGAGSWGDLGGCGSDSWERLSGANKSPSGSGASTRACQLGRGDSWGDLGGSWSDSSERIPGPSSFSSEDSALGPHPARSRGGSLFDSKLTKLGQHLCGALSGAQGKRVLDSLDDAFGTFDVERVREVWARTWDSEDGMELMCVLDVNDD